MTITVLWLSALDWVFGALVLLAGYLLARTVWRLIMGGG